MTKYFQVPTIMCVGCADTIRGALFNLDAHAKVTIDVGKKVVGIDSQLSSVSIQEAIVNTGHEVTERWTAT